MPLALEGIKVVDLCRAGPGQMATGILADYGADVVTIVEPGYAARRATGGAVDASFATINRRNKRSIFLSLRYPEGQEIFYRLIRQADALMESNRPGVAKRLGADYETLHALNPKLIYCALSGYGQYGPYSKIPGHDLSYQGVAGLLPLDDTGIPYVPPFNQADLNAAWYGAIAILTGLVSRSLNGQGQYIDVGFSDASLTLSPGGIGDEMLQGAYPCYGIYKCKDDKFISLSVREPWFWERLCQLLGREDYIPHPRPQGELLGEMFEFFHKSFGEKTRQEWLDLLEENDNQFGPVNTTVEEIITDPHNQARDMIIEVLNQVTGENQQQAGLVMKLSETPGSIRWGPTLMGQDTDTVLYDLGYSNKQMAELRTSGVIA